MNELRDELQSSAVDINCNIDLPEDTKPTLQNDEILEDSSTDDDDIQEVYNNFATGALKKKQEKQNQCFESVAKGAIIHEDGYTSAQQQSLPMSPSPPPLMIGIQKDVNKNINTLQMALVFPTYLSPSEKYDEPTDGHCEHPRKQTIIDEDAADIDDTVNLVKSALTKKQVESVAKGMISPEDDWLISAKQRQSPPNLSTQSLFSQPNSLFPSEDSNSSRKRSGLLSSHAGDDERSSGLKYFGINWEALEKKKKLHNNVRLLPTDNIFELQSPPMSPSPPLATSHEHDYDDNATSRKYLELLPSSADDCENSCDSQYDGLDWDALKKKNKICKKLGSSLMSPEGFLEVAPPISPSPPISSSRQLAMSQQNDNQPPLTDMQFASNLFPSENSNKPTDAHCESPKKKKKIGFDWDALKKRNELRKKFGLSPMSPEEFLEVAPSIPPSPPFARGRQNDDKDHQSATNLPPFGKLNEPTYSLCKSNGKTKKYAESFPMILRRLLNDLNHVNHGTDIAFYDAGGSAFTILDDEAFEAVMTMYFPKMDSFSTFRLQLRIYSFKESPNPFLNSVTYSHPQFHRDRPLLVAQMTTRN